MGFFRDFVLFFAGAEAFHTVFHIALPLLVNLPFETKYVALTPELNLIAIVINGLITIGLLWGVAKLSRAKSN